MLLGVWKKEMREEITDRAFSKIWGIHGVNESGILFL